MPAHSLTFVNTTGPPKLSKSAAKQVRGHVTKVKFAARRQRKAIPDYLKDEMERASSKTPSPVTSLVHQIPWSEVELANTVSLAITRSDPHQAGVLLNTFWYPLFLSRRDQQTDESDAAWLDLFVSDPALVEVTIAAGMRYWLASDECKRRGGEHYSRAVDMVVRSMASGKAYSDGFLATIFTLALTERLQGSDAAWEMHIGGAAQAIGQRISYGMLAMPPLLMDLVVMDLVNEVYGFPRVFHQSIVAQLEGQSYRALKNAAAISRHLSQLRKTVGENRNRWLNPSDVPRDVEEMWMKCYIEVGFLQADENPFVRATAVGFKLVLYFLATPEARRGLWQTADELKEALSKLPGRSCMYMDLTSCPLVLGAVAAKEGSEARAWFVDKLRCGVEAVQSRGWSECFGILERTASVDGYLLSRLRSLAPEIMPPAVG